MDNSIRERFKEVIRHTHVLFELNNINGNHQLTPIGTCFFCSPSGYLLTCAHIISASKKLYIAKPDKIDSHYSYKLTKIENDKLDEVNIISIDGVNDIALLKWKRYERRNMSSNLIGTQKTVFIGDDIIIAGYPFINYRHFILKASKSIISAKLIDESTKIYIADGMVYEGNSGGPAISTITGTIVGVVSGKFRAFESPASIGGVDLGNESSMIKIISAEHVVDLVSSHGVHINA